MFGIDQILQDEIDPQAVEIVPRNDEVAPAEWTACPVARPFVLAVTLKTPETERVKTAWHMSWTAEIFQAYRTFYDLVRSSFPRRS